MSVKNYQIRLKVLSPLHIGSGEHLNPLNYIVKNNHLYYLNEGQYIKKLLNTPDSRLKEVVDTADIYNIVNYYYNQFDENDTQLYKHSYPVDPEFQSAFLNNLRSKDNQNLLLEFYRSELFSEPVIPGSSLKGCFRTILLSAMQTHLNTGIYQKRRGNRFVNDAQLTEASVMSMRINYEKFDVKSDPFKYFKVSDIHAGTDSLTVQKIENKTTGRTSAIPYFAEVIKSSDQVYTGTLSINSEMTRYFDRSLNLNINNIANYLVQSAKVFYYNIIQKDILKLKSINSLNGLRSALVNYDSLKDTPNKAVFRLGKGQGCHSLSLRMSNLNPKSRNLAQNQTLGWVEIEFVDM
ncbi:MAG TPA: type III-A CRISPR-associated RAMP protein Csm5 [Candidatus Cloacimonadota bacterium]|nr:type III-A CRISPR-associated RAMP protein Csm5 [Candidatus Cloacimonadota bacterium]